MWSAKDPAVEVIEVESGRATLRVALESIAGDDEGFPTGGPDWSVEDYDRFAGWALIVVPADEVEGLCAEVA